MADFARRSRDFTAMLDASSDAIKAAQFSNAVNILEAYIADPDHLGTNVAAQMLADCYFRLRKPEQAFAILAPFCTADADPELLLRASLASARKGVVFEGQREYVVGYILSRYREAKDTSSNWPQGNTPADIEAISCLAIAIQDSVSGLGRRSYLQEALKLDPTNPLACELLGEIEYDAGHFALAKELFEKASQRTVASRQWYIQKKISDSEYLRTQFGG